MLIDVDWCWLMLIDVDWCWLKLIDADWCHRVTQVRVYPRPLDVHFWNHCVIIHSVCCRWFNQGLELQPIANCPCWGTCCKEDLLNKAPLALLATASQALVLEQERAAPLEARDHLQPVGAGLPWPLNPPLTSLPPRSLSTFTGGACCLRGAQGRSAPQSGRHCSASETGAATPCCGPR